MLEFNGTVTLGEVAQLTGTVVAVVSAYGRIRERLARLETKVDAMWEERGPDRRPVARRDR